jgi:hypothetical protein
MPDILEHWPAAQINLNALAEFSRLCGHAPENGVPVLYPHVFGFPLHMALLTHPAQPYSIRDAFQVRNRLTLHSRFVTGAPLAMETRTGAHRVLAKGIEVDLHTRLSRDGATLWDSTATYFYRLPQRVASGVASRSPDLANAAVIENFLTPPAGGLRFAVATGDFNPLHWSRSYARRIGFGVPSLHAQHAAALCLAHVPRRTDAPGTLELWIKGPVPYSTSVTLRAVERGADLEFGLSLPGDERSALVGRFREQAL